ncbi:MAG: hypothetical protein V2A73_03670 [Pseudomonadota bacterium]
MQECKPVVLALELLILTCLVQHRIKPGLSAMATGWVGAERGSASEADGWERSYGINAGLRWEW